VSRYGATASFELLQSAYNTTLEAQIRWASGVAVHPTLSGPVARLYRAARDTSSTRSNEFESSASVVRHHQVVQVPEASGSSLALEMGLPFLRSCQSLSYSSISQHVMKKPWSRTLREEHGLSVLRRIFGLKRAEVTGGWWKRHNEELHSLYSASSIIRMIKSRRMRWAGHVGCTRENRNAYRILAGKPKVERPLRGPRSRWGPVEGSCEWAN
jgi:hypothetical protein